MAHLPLDDFGDRTWKKHTRTILDIEIERGYEKLKDSPLVELEGSKITLYKTKSEAEAAALKRLGDLYEDGPNFFLKATDMIRHCLPLYKLGKNNPNDGNFFLCAQLAPGVILHVNSVAAKKEIFVLLPHGDNPRSKPVKVHIAHIIKWHKNRKLKALTTRVKQLEAMLALKNARIQAELGLNAVLRSSKIVYDRLTLFLNEYLKLQSKLETRSSAAKKLRYKKVLKKVREFCNDREDIINLQEEFSSLNPRMYEEKEFIRMRIGHCNKVSKLYSVQEKKLEKIMSTI